MPIYPGVPLAMSPAAPTPYSNSFARQPIPNDDTQALYNRWKDLEESSSRLDEAALSQVPDGRLKPPKMQRTPSRNSARSVTEGMDNMVINDHKAYGGVKKPRAKRHGPLSDAARAKASLFRIIRACDVCSRRKVSCIHIDWSKFEAGRHGSSSQTLHTPVPIPKPQCGSGHKPQMQQDLRGIGSSQPPLPYIRPGPDLDMLDELIADHSTPGNAALPNIPQHESSMRALELQQHTEEQHVPIGRLLSVREDVWECQSGSDADLSYETTSSISADPRCAERFGTLSSLKSHYRANHHRFRESDKPYLYKCLECDFLNEISGPRCAVCSSLQPLEPQYWAYVGLTLLRDTIPIPNVSPPRRNHDSIFPSSSGSSSFHYPTGNAFSTSYSNSPANGFWSLVASPSCSFPVYQLNQEVRSVQDVAARIFGVSLVVLFFVYTFGWVTHGLRCCINAVVVGLTTGHILGVSLLCIATGVVLTSVCRYMIAHVLLPAATGRCFFIRDVLGLSDRQVH